MKKNLFTFLLLLFPLFSLHAIPGVESFIKDSSGEYVFYRDYSFNRESYIGFMTYDESTFAARYFAPASKELAPCDIQLLFTVDSTKPYLEMTGERFISEIKQEDTDVINYIHDLIYELAARRRKAGEISGNVHLNPELNPNVKYVENISFMENGFLSEQDYAQFGGNVFIYFDYYIPIFNVKKICDNSSKTVLEAVCIGKIKDETDDSFFSFVPLCPEESITGKIALKKNKNSFKLKDDFSFIQLDENWRLNEENVNCAFLQQDSARAIIAVSAVDSYNLVSFVRSALRSKRGNWIALNKVSFVSEKGKTFINSTGYSYTGSTKNVTGILSEKKTDSENINYNSVLIFGADSALYDSNRKYFDGIFKSWK